ncbi:phytoene desaturase family protein [Corynebacterium sp. H130]|uniref:phytoene desaturase family protein n=1 Tax=Corynebacterium sp. H130 TaxID=3133444 RepID=UPI0030B43E91
MRAIIIGGGIAGLATAALLADAGAEVTLLEKNSELGGRAGSLQVDGFTFDTGPSWYLMPEAFDRFFASLGTATRERLNLVDLSPAYRVFPENAAAFDVETGKAPELFESFEPGAGAVAQKYLETASFTYRVAVDSFLYTTFSSLAPFLTKQVLGNIALLTQLLTLNLHQWVARDFHDRRIRQVLEYPAVFLSSAPRRTPAMYHLLSHTDLVEGVRYPMGGFSQLMATIADLAREKGTEIRTGATVTAITTSAGSVTGVRVMDNDKLAHLSADIVVSGADLNHTESLLPQQLRTTKWDRKDPGISCVVALLGVRGELPELTHHQLILSEDWDADFRALEKGDGYSRSIYVCKASETDPGCAPAGHSNVFVLIPVPAREDFGHGGDQKVESIIDQVIALIDERTGSRIAGNVVVRRSIGPSDFAENFNAWRGNAIGLAHTLGQSAFLRGSNASRKVDGLYFAGATTVPGVGLPMCLISAENVLTRLREEGKL